MTDLEKLKAENERLTQELSVKTMQLRNVLATARRMQQRLKSDTVDRNFVVEIFQALERFCANAGVKPSILRDQQQGEPS